MSLSATPTHGRTGWPLFVRYAALLLVLALYCPPIHAGDETTGQPYQQWTLEEAVAVLNESAWARKETFTRVVGGIGSGISGEKEIYNTFFVRFLSARPVREAYARIRQIQAGYDTLSSEERHRFDAALAGGLKMDVSRWIVVTVHFRSNDPRTERQVRQFLEMQTVQSLKSRAFLSTARFPQLVLAAYFPPQDDVVGAKFVFPRQFEGSPVVSAKDARVSFELDIPGFEPDLRVNFSVAEMLVAGEPVL